jgi:hypothetical protein
MSPTNQPPFQTRQEIERYFSGKTIKCLLCGRRFRRLGVHITAKHDMSVNEYRSSFGLPWTRGLTSATSHARGWTERRKDKARKLARKSRFFKLAHLTPRRELAPYLKTEAIQHLGNPRTLNKKIERRMRALFDKGLSVRAIARAIRVSTSTVHRRTKHWRHQ